MTANKSHQQPFYLTVKVIVLQLHPSTPSIQQTIVKALNNLANTSINDRSLPSSLCKLSNLSAPIVSETTK